MQHPNIWLEFKQIIIQNLGATPVLMIAYDQHILKMNTSIDAGFLCAALAQIKFRVQS